jgi:uncharacterized membrane protein YkoI
MKSWLGAALCVSLALLATAAWARDGDGQRFRYGGDKWSNHRYGESLDNLVSGLRRRHAGRVLSADTVEEEGRAVHRIRILDERGRVQGLRFDSATGRPLRRPR